MYLLIDDCRTYGDVIAKTPEAARLLLTNCVWETVGFDHDLGAAESGYDILKWAIEQDVLPDNIQLVTSNPVGRKSMSDALEAAGFYKEPNGVIFKRKK